MLKLKQSSERYLLPANQVEEELKFLLRESHDEIEQMCVKSILSYKTDTIIKGKIVGVSNDMVIVDIGCKSEGYISVNEFSEPSEIEVGKEIEVYLENIDTGTGIIGISKKKADSIRTWEKLLATYKEGDVVEGKIIRKVKGGVALDIGVPVFLPASQLDIKKVQEPLDYVGLKTKAVILKMDHQKMNIIVSRKKYLEMEQEKSRKAFLDTVKEGDIVKCTIKSITNYGLFVETNGVEGLILAGDLSWKRPVKPSELFKVGDVIDARVLKVDKEKERLNLGYKQLVEDPWKNIKEKYTPGKKVTGKVVSIMPFGAFVELEPGIEGLIPISEMSWDKKIGHPSEILSVNDILELVVLQINMEKRTVILGMKQVEFDPWTAIAEKYKVGQKVKGIVENITNYGAFVSIDENVEGLVHVSDLSWTKKVYHPAEVLKKGDEVEVVILSIDTARKRIALGIKQLQPNPWETTIPEKYPVGSKVIGRVSRIAAFGVFVSLDDEVEGLIGFKKPGAKGDKEPDLPRLEPGDKVEVEIKKVDARAARIGLGFVRLIKEDEQIS